MLQPMIAISTPAASGPTQRGPPVSWTTRVEYVVTEDIVIVVDDVDDIDRRVALQAGGPHAASIAHPGPIGTPLGSCRRCVDRREHTL